MVEELVLGRIKDSRPEPDHDVAFEKESQRLARCEKKRRDLPPTIILQMPKVGPRAATIDPRRTKPVHMRETVLTPNLHSRERESEGERGGEGGGGAGEGE